MLLVVCTDAPAPSWDELESVMLAVKLVVHGLVEFIQNFSKKNHDTPQVKETQAPSKRLKPQINQRLCRIKVAWICASLEIQKCWC